MSEQRRFRFAIANLLLMMLPVAVFVAALRATWPYSGFVVLIGGPICLCSAIGAFVDGFKGLLVMLVFSAVGCALTFAVVSFAMRMGWI